MTSDIAAPAASSPSSLGAVLDHLFEHRDAKDPGGALAAWNGLRLENKKSLCDDLSTAGVIRYEGTEPKLTPLGILIAEARPHAPKSPTRAVSAKPNRRPAGAPWLRGLRWLVRKLTPVRSEASALDWVVVAILWILIAAAIAALSITHGKVEPLPLFHVGAQGCLVIATLYIAAGVIYHPPLAPFATLPELQEHVCRTLTEASRHCKIGLLFFIAGTAIDFADKAKYLEKWLQ